MSFDKIALFDDIRAKAKVDQTIDPTSWIHTCDNEWFHRVMFFNKYSLKLTVTGRATMAQFYQEYSFKSTLTPKSISKLHRMQVPYFLLSQKRVVIYDEMEATIVAIHGDWIEYLDNL